MMKKLLIAPALALFLFSCSDSDDCHECHIAWQNSANEEVEVEIGEFCGSELSDVESNGYTLASEQVIGNDTVPAGDYAGSDIHCEEHEH
jgi:hypothetical protein